MTYRGRVKNGQIVLERGATLSEGMVVDVTAVAQTGARPDRGSLEAVLSSRARWFGTNAEAEQLLDEMRREKWAEVEAQRMRPDSES